jgi:hypothetical protein
MRTALVVLLVVAVVVCACPAFAAAKVAKPGMLGAGMVAESAQMSVKIAGIDHAKHTVTLQMPDGRIKTYKVPDTVKNLGMLKKGDKITATLIESLAVYVEKGGPRPSAGEMETVTIRPKGAGVVIAKTMRVTGKIQYVDARNRSMTITGPSGKSRTLKVSQSVKNLSKLKAGDDVVARYTEALAVALKKPGK